MQRFGTRGSFRVKNFDIKNIKVIQAPLAGISDNVYRGLIRKTGAKCLLTTEMLSSEALRTCKDPKIARFSEDEYPLSFQIVGHKPDLMANAARTLEGRASSIDINFGCPVNKIVKSNDGSGLMRTPELAREIVREVRKATTLPLSAKFRLGWSKENENFIEFGKMLEEEGVDFVTLHGRTRHDLYSGHSDWEKIGQLVSELKIPVFANGDIKTLADAIECFKVTGAHGVSIGRGIMGDFTLPLRIENYLETGVMESEPDFSEKIDMLKTHFKLEIERMGEVNGVKFMRKFYTYYIQGVKNASKYREVLVRIDSAEELLRTLDEILDIYYSNCG